MQSIKRERRNHSSWLNQFKGGSRTQYERAWRYFAEYIHPKNESWILSNLHSEDWGAHLVNFRVWLSKKTKQRGKGTLSDNATKQLSNAIRGYLIHVGATLSLTKAQKFALTKIESLPETDYPLNLKVKEALMRVADPYEDYVLCAGVSFGLRVSDFSGLRRGQLEPLIDQEPPIPLGELMTVKEGVRAFPHIDRDAKESIQNLLRVMDSEGRSSPQEPMLQFQSKYPEEEVNNILKGLFAKAQIPLGEFRVRFHILRKFLTDQLANVCAEDKWKHFVGKKTKSPYVSAEGQEAYRKVMEFTCVNHKNIAVPKDVKVLQNQIERLEHQLAEERATMKSVVEALKKLGIDVEKEGAILLT